MALLDWVAGLSGAVIAGAALLDVFTTIVVPRALNPGVNALRFIRRGLLGPWKRLAARSGSASTLLTVFAALILVFAFMAWFGALALGWSLMGWAVRRDFHPALQSFWEALFQVTSAMVTMGLSGHTAAGGARAVMSVAGLSGLLLVTLDLTYILQIQNALSQRDPFVALVSARAGAPPDGLQLLVNLARLRPQESLGGFFIRAESWAAVVFQVHMAHPVLAYFRSVDDQNDWLLSLGAMLEAAILLIALTESSPETGQAELFRRTGVQTVRQLCGVFGVRASTPSPPTAETIERLRSDLAGAGYRLEGGDFAGRLASMRGDFASQVHAMVEHFGVRPPVWASGTPQTFGNEPDLS